MGKEKNSSEDTIKTIRRRTRRHHSAEEKIRIVLEGLHGQPTPPSKPRLSQRR